MKTISISGFGGGYENECQRMLWNGINYLREQKLIGEINTGIEFQSFENVYGACFPKGEPAEKLSEAVMRGIDEATGAMHHAVMGHLMFICKMGTEKWFEEFRDLPERIFDWDGTVKSCPKTDLSEKLG